VLAAARTLPMLSRGRLVLVRGIGEKRAQKFTEELLVEYLEAPLETTCLVLEAESVDKRQRWVKRVAKIGRVIECTGPNRPADVRRWIETRLTQRGARAGSGVAAALYELVGADLDRLSLEIEKLCLYAGERGQIDADDVTELVGQLRPRALYELTDAIGERRLTNALRLVAELTEQGEAPLALVGAREPSAGCCARESGRSSGRGAEAAGRAPVRGAEARRSGASLRSAPAARVPGRGATHGRGAEGRASGRSAARDRAAGSGRLRVTARQGQGADSTSLRASRGARPCAKRSSCARRPCSKPCAAGARPSSAGPACPVPAPRHRCLHGTADVLRI
jgi:hypothetical protein